MHASMICAASSMMRLSYWKASAIRSLRLMAACVHVIATTWPSRIEREGERESASARERERVNPSERASERERERESEGERAIERY